MTAPPDRDAERRVNRSVDVADRDAERRVNRPVDAADRDAERHVNRPGVGVVHVVGAGMAGLAAAYALATQGRMVTLHESTPGAGGRARALPDGTDNGTHALIGANRAALGFLDAIGARQFWLEPEPDGLPVLDLADGSARHVALSPFGWWRADRRPAGVTLGAVLAMAGMALPGEDRTIAESMRAHPAFLRG
ncbi:MAG: hypothetical protein JWR00_3692, partial [Rubritepida sp.]|nr:hypothetical protein [Rubritepida sp.]